MVIVNDGSPDNTTKVLAYLTNNFNVLLCIQEAMKFVSQYGTDKVRLLEFERNRGKGGAVRMVRRAHRFISAASFSHIVGLS